MAHGGHSREWLASWLFVLVSMAVVCTYSEWRVLSGPANLYPGGIDTMGHLTKVSVLAERWARGVFSDWLPQWYMGATIVQYYPPLSIWASALVQLLTSNILVTFRVVTWGCLFLGGVSAAFLSKKLGGNAAAMVAGGVFYAFSNYTLFSVFIDGTLGRAFSMPIYPLLLCCLIDLVDTPSRWNRLASLTLVLSLILCHAMHAYLLFVTVAIFMSTWCIKGGSWIQKMLRLTEAAVMGVLLSSFWAIPGATQFEIPGVPWSPPEMAGIRTVTLATFIDPGSPYGSTAVVIMAIFGLFVLTKRQSSKYLGFSLAASSLITLSLIYGPQNPLYNLLPMGKSLAPLRFMNAAALPLAISAGLFVGDAWAWLRSIKTFWSVPAAVIVSSSLIVVSLFSNAPVVLPLPTDYHNLKELVEKIPTTGQGLFGSGRVAEELPNQGGEAAFIPVSLGFQITAGWNIEGTPHLYTLHEHNIAYSEGSCEYVLRNWYLWNVRSALVDVKYTDMIETLVNQGWQNLGVSSMISLMTLDRAPSYINYLSSSTIVIGRSSFYLSSLFPGITQGRESDPLEYDDAYLRNFETIVLYDLPPTNVELLEKRIIDWAKQGKRVVLDLSVSDQIGDVLGVRHRDISLSSAVTLMPTPEGALMYDGPTEVPLKDGRGAVYDGLDSTYLTAVVDGETVCVSGTRELDMGSVFFVGLHLPRLVSKDGREQARQILDPLIYTDTDRIPTIPKPLAIASETWSAKGVTFEYQTENSVAAVISITHTPRWHAYVDGASTTIYQNENLLLVNLPEGRHTVRVEYRGTWVTGAGWLVTVLALAYVAARTVLPKRSWRRSTRNWGDVP